MKEPSFADAFDVLCLQAAADGREQVLFGDCLPRARRVLRPFFIGRAFPAVYLEFPLMGEPFLDVTALYGSLDVGTRIDSPQTGDVGALIDWFSAATEGVKGVGMGFELDTKEKQVPEAAVHFQPRMNSHLVRPFFDAIGEPERAEQYYELERRLPESWHPEFLGFFRGRPDSPLRVCGYLIIQECQLCAQDPRRITEVFEAAGFHAANDGMLRQMRELMQIADARFDYQFDIYPDGTLGSTFALDVQFRTETPEAVHDSFSEGLGAQVMRLFESWGIADERWNHVPRAAFARSIPVERETGEGAQYAFTLMPGWAKARWCDGVLQPAKFYFFGKAGVL